MSNETQWENVYSDLVSLESGDFTAYVECFKNSSGLYGWEILGPDGETRADKTVKVGWDWSIESAKLAAERHLAHLTEI